jgi:hypothetical protein
MARLLAVVGLFCLVLMPGAGWTAATPATNWDWPPSSPHPSLQMAAQGPLEAQILADQSSPARTFQLWSARPLFGLKQDADTLRLPGNLEVRVSFLYHREHAFFTPDRPIQSHLLFQYSMDYGVLPNLQVGLRGFFYHPQSEDPALQKRYGSLALGWGPGVKYDLGRWSFTFSSQLNPGYGEQPKDLQNWFRVWYAF